MRRPSVLLVEDNAQLGSVLRRILVHLDFEQVEHLTTARAALVALRTRPAEVLLLDVSLSPVDAFPHGFAAAREIVRLFPATRIIFTSGYALGDLEPERAGFPVAHFLLKPFTPSELVATIHRAANGDADSR